MAKKKLNSIVWPNIPNDVYYLDADKVEYDDTETYSEGSVGDALQNKANIDGSYENLTAGNAEQIVTDIRANDQTPYLFRTAGGSVDIGDREYINGIVGGTVAWNQLADPTYMHASGTESDVAFTKDGGKLTVSGTASANIYASVCGQYTPTSGHKMLYIGAPSEIANVTFYDDSAVRQFDGKTTYALINASGVKIDFKMKILSGSSVNGTVIPQIFDLTLMFGSTIADYIYSLEQANAGAGVAWFKKLFPKPYYAYNAGELMSVKGLVSHDMVGFNAWDEEWEVGSYNSGTGEKVENPSTIRNKNYIPALPNISYFAPVVVYNVFCYDADKQYLGTAAYQYVAPPSEGYIWTTKANTAFIAFITDNTKYGTTYNHDICINLSWDGSEDGNYEPYQKWSYPLDSDLELRGIPKLDASNNLYYDGDTYESDGTVTRKYGIVDLGTLNWTYYQTDNVFYTQVSGIVRKVDNAVCSKYPLTNRGVGNMNDKTLTLSSGGSDTMWIKDTSYGTDATAFKAAMSGVYLVYELATPTTESADPYTNPQIVNDFGTEEFVISNTVAVPIPVGHNTDYPVNLKAKVEMMPNSPDGDGDYIVRQTNGTNEYVSIANNATISGLVSRSPVASGADGTYVLKATISGGTVTYSWEAE